MLDPDVAALLDLMNSTGAPALSDGTVDQARHNYDAAPKPPPDPIDRVEDRFVAGPAGPIPVRLYATRDPSVDADALRPVVAFFHGGGWVLSHLDGHDALCRRLAIVSGALVVSVGYRLAPEHPFPAPHDDCWAVTSWLSRHATEWGGDPTRLAVCGDSAGGNLAAGVALRARDEGVALRLQLLIYPCIDDRQDAYPSMTENRDGYFLTAADMNWFWNQYVPTSHRLDARAVPARADVLAGVAPAWVMTAEYDPLRDEGEAYARRLSESGVPAEIVRYPGVVHGFVTRWHVMQRAEHAHRDIGEVLRQALG